MKGASSKLPGRDIDLRCYRFHVVPFLFVGTNSPQPNHPHAHHEHSHLCALDPLRPLLSAICYFAPISPCPRPCQSVLVPAPPNSSPTPLSPSSISPLTFSPTNSPPSKNNVEEDGFFRTPLPR